ncbi:hypothetical protein W97_08611 [Coniosporium apollinis CBS 100218]|uniref:Succinate dehydrogenase, cytochrome b556 subunit n=1 Tax=Coniosporium apollinis (strain CBS 100218) TaxID=1168221 RepID=R7Z5Z1_CONA1|nr:uncharacterized protein W97_08611 [Coniosporium apollinis CBS 100218]EON69351.1 hypothetical protein W97_08611 [Coniosporium apollinis CBS 100218]
MRGGAARAVFRSPVAQVAPRRTAATQNMPDNAARDMLVKQRLNRPVSPHLGIYRPQITWYGSALNRITASILSGGFYIFGFSYLIAPLFGWDLSSQRLAKSFGSLPKSVKVGTKMLLAFPFTYHSLNGVRHLAWDLGYGFSNKAVMQTGWATVAASVASSLGLAFV